MTVAKRDTTMSIASIERHHATRSCEESAKEASEPMSHEELMRKDWPADNAALDPDHVALARLLDELEGMCSGRLAPQGVCGDCSGIEIEACRSRLQGICNRMQTLLLDHFEREQELMAALPRDLATRAHCERHRQEHVNFSTRYNLAATRLNASLPATGARELEALVFDWIRSHALEYDAELVTIMNDAHDGPRCYV